MSSSMNFSRKRPVGEILNQGVEITKEISEGFFIVKVPKILAEQLENVDADEEIGVLERYEEEEVGNPPEDSMIEENSKKTSKKNRHNERYEIRVTNPTLLQSGLVSDGSNNLNLGFRPEEYVMQPIERPEDKYIDQNIYAIIEDKQKGTRYFSGTARTPMFTMLPKSKKKQKELLKSLTIEQNMRIHNRLENVEVTEDLSDLTMKQNNSSTSMTIPISNMELERRYRLEQSNAKRTTINLMDLARRAEKKTNGHQKEESAMDLETKMRAKDNNLAVSTRKNKVTSESQARDLIFERFEEENLYTLKGLRKNLEDAGYLIAEKLTKQILNGSEGGMDAIATYEKGGPFRNHYHLNSKYSTQYEVGDKVKLIKETLKIEIQENPDFPRNAVYVIQEISQDLSERKYRLMDQANGKILKHKFFEAFEIFRES